MRFVSLLPFMSWKSVLYMFPVYQIILGIFCPDGILACDQQRNNSFSTIIGKTLPSLVRCSSFTVLSSIGPTTLSGVRELRRLQRDLKHLQHSAYCATTFSNLKTPFKVSLKKTSIFCEVIYEMFHNCDDHSSLDFYILFVFYTYYTPRSAYNALYQKNGALIFIFFVYCFYIIFS